MLKYLLFLLLGETNLTDSVSSPNVQIVLIIINIDWISVKSPIKDVPYLLFREYINR